MKYSRLSSTFSKAMKKIISMNKILYVYQISFSFYVPIFVIVLILACAIVRIKFTTTCEETTVWVAILSSTVGYILTSQSYG